MEANSKANASSTFFASGARTAWRSLRPSRMRGVPAGVEEEFIDASMVLRPVMHDPPYRRTMFGVTDPLTLNQAVIGAGAAMLTGFVIHGLPPLSFEHKHYHKVDSCFSQHLTETGTRY